MSFVKREEIGVTEKKDDEVKKSKDFNLHSEDAVVPRDQTRGGHV